MQCPKCGHENPRGTEICQGCRRVKFVSKKAETKKPAPAAEAPKRPGSRRTKAVSPDAIPAARPKAPSPDDGTAAKKTPSRRTAAIRPEGLPPALPLSAAPTQRRPRPSGADALRPSPEGATSPARATSPKLKLPGLGALGGPPRMAKRHLLERVGAPPIEISPGKVFTFGRNETCSLPIPSTRVSRDHAEIRWTAGGRPVLADKGSANGTFVGGKPVQEHPLVPGDEIEIGPFVCVYRHGDGASAPPPSGGMKTMLEPGDLLSGQIGEGGLAEVLQGIDFNKKTGTLLSFSADGQGWITFADGSPTAAQAGKLANEEAIFFLLALKEGRFSFTQELKTKERLMRATVTGLLLEWGRRADEGHLGG